MSLVDISKLVRKIYAPLDYHKTKFAKAAKKKRIMKKWVNRFGERSTIEELLWGDNLMLKDMDENNLLLLQKED